MIPSPSALRRKIWYRVVHPFAFCFMLIGTPCIAHPQALKTKICVKLRSATWDEQRISKAVQARFQTLQKAARLHAQGSTAKTHKEQRTKQRLRRVSRGICHSST